MSESFKPGDIVQLRSGGPIMTVKDVDDDEAQCCWFCLEADGSWSDLQEMAFAVAVLRTAPTVSINEVVAKLRLPLEGARPDREGVGHYSPPPGMEGCIPPNPFYGMRP